MKYINERALNFAGVQNLKKGTAVYCANSIVILEDAVETNRAACFGVIEDVASEVINGVQGGYVFVNGSWSRCVYVPETETDKLCRDAFNCEVLNAIKSVISSYNKNGCCYSINDVMAFLKSR